MPADLFVPAGIGGLLTDEVIDALEARAVCGPANNPLADHSGAARLAGRGILYAPDFVVNAGGVIYLDLVAKRIGTREEVMHRVAGIGDTLRRLFAEVGCARRHPARGRRASRRRATHERAAPGRARTGARPDLIHCSSGHRRYDSVS